MKTHKELVIENNWKIVVDQSEDVKSLQIENIKMVQFATPHEEYVTWDMMLDRAKQYNAVGSQEMAEWILNNQSHIPESWKPYNLIFPRTIWKSITEQMSCPFLSFKENKWVLSYYWFLFDFHHDDRFLIIKK